MALNATEGSALEVAKYIASIKNDNEYREKAKELAINGNQPGLAELIVGEAAVLLEQADAEATLTLIALILASMNDSNLLDNFLEKIVADSCCFLSSKLNILSALYNNLPSTKKHRLQVYSTMINICGKNEDIESLKSLLRCHDTVLSELNLSSEETKALTLLIIKALEGKEYIFSLILLSVNTAATITL